MQKKRMHYGKVAHHPTRNDLFVLNPEEEKVQLSRPPSSLRTGGKPTINDLFVTSRA
jgi:hypothetical protein